MSEDIQVIPTDETAVLSEVESKLDESRGKHLPPFNNLANDEELCKRFAKWLRKQFSVFESQQQRHKFVSDEDGIMNTADKMLRVSLNRETSSAQYQPTLSDVSSTIFFREHRAMTASLNSIFLDEKDMPAEYEPELNTNVYSDEDGKFIAEKRNLLELHTFDEDKRREKTRSLNHLLMEYGNVCVSNEWNRVVETKKIKTVGYYDADGNPVPFDPENPPLEMFDVNGDQLMEVLDDKGSPIHFVWIEKQVVTADTPTLLIHDIKDCYFDALLDDPNLWRCFIKVGQIPYETIIGMQAQGEILNADKIKPTHLYTGEIEDTVENRLANADENVTPGATGLVSVFHAWGYVPIKENKKRNGKGKWDEAKTIPSLYWGLYAGDIRSGNVVPLKLIKNPYQHGKIPYKIIHTHRDDKGAFHKCLAQILTPIYWQACTILNMAFDNVLERNRAPWVIDGPIHTKDLTFRPDKAIRISKGTTMTRVVVPDSTGLTMQQMGWIEKDANSTSGANDTIMAEPMGARTSALEAKNVFDQSMLPLDDMASYIGDQLLPWMYEMDAALWEQFGDPDRVIMVTRNNTVEEVKPSHIWGPVKVRVTAVSRFRNNVVRRQEVNSFIQNVLPLAGKDMGPQGTREFFRDAFKLFGFDRAREYIPDYGEYDAKARAISAGNVLLNGKWIEPKQGENHAAWLAVLTPMAREYELLPDADRNEEGLRMLNAHIELRKQMVNQSPNGIPPQGQLQERPQPTEQGSTVIPGNGAEMVQNISEAQEGALANV